MAFYLSSNGTKEPMILFFNKIKQIVGKSIECVKYLCQMMTLYFMKHEKKSSVQQSCIVACWWHININWDKHLNEKIKHTNK